MLVVADQLCIQLSSTPIAILSPVEGQPTVISYSEPLSGEGVC